MPPLLVLTVALTITLTATLVLTLVACALLTIYTATVTWALDLDATTLIAVFAQALPRFLTTTLARMPLEFDTAVGRLANVLLNVGTILFGKHPDAEGYDSNQKQVEEIATNSNETSPERTEHNLLFDLLDLFILPLVCKKSSGVVYFVMPFFFNPCSPCCTPSTTLGCCPNYPLPSSIYWTTEKFGIVTDDGKLNYYGYDPVDGNTWRGTTFDPTSNVYLAPCYSLTCPPGTGICNKNQGCGFLINNGYATTITNSTCSPFYLEVELGPLVVLKMVADSGTPSLPYCCSGWKSSDLTVTLQGARFGRNLDDLNYLQYVDPAFYDICFNPTGTSILSCSGCDCMDGVQFTMQRYDTPIPWVHPQLSKLYTNSTGWHVVTTVCDGTSEWGILDCLGASAIAGWPCGYTLVATCGVDSGSPIMTSQGYSLWEGGSAFEFGDTPVCGTGCYGFLLNPSAPVTGAATGICCNPNVPGIDNTFGIAQRATWVWVTDNANKICADGMRTADVYHNPDGMPHTLNATLVLPTGVVGAATGCPLLYGQTFALDWNDTSHSWRGRGTTVEGPYDIPIYSLYGKGSPFVEVLYNRDGWKMAMTCRTWPSGDSMPTNIGCGCVELSYFDNSPSINQQTPVVISETPVYLTSRFYPMCCPASGTVFGSTPAQIDVVITE